jgi:DNA invertase Pin-like site-specific DNA recombinase
MSVAIAYTRLSPSEGRSGLGLEAQQEDIQRFADQHGFEISSWFQDIQTGTGSDPLSKRPGLAQAFRMAKKLKCPIIVSKLDRLSRNVKFLAGLKARDTLFHVVQFGIRNDDLMLNIHVSVAQQKRQQIGEKIKAALARKKAQGHLLGNRTNLETAQECGRQRVKANADAFAKGVKELITERRVRGASLAEIAQQLNLMGLKTARGSEWLPMQVSRILARAVNFDASDRPPEKYF